MMVEKSVEWLTGETEVLGENLAQRHFCPSQNLTWPNPCLNPGRRGGKPATNRLSYGALVTHYSTWGKSCCRPTCSGSDYTEGIKICLVPDTHSSKSHHVCNSLYWIIGVTRYYISLESVLLLVEQTPWICGALVCETQEEAQCSSCIVVCL
jgi:hypothetical protein